MTLLALGVKNPSVSAGDIRDAGLISASGRSPGVGSGNRLQNSCHGQKNLVGYSPWSCKESDNLNM